MMVIVVSRVLMVGIGQELLTTLEYIVCLTAMFNVLTMYQRLAD